MAGKIKMVMAALMLAAYVFSAAGCAAVWFLAGAGTAATVGAVMNEQKKE